MPELTARDRCDACQAQAVYLANKSGLSELLFCGHHHSKHKYALVSDGWTIDSSREDMVGAPS